MKLFWGQSHLTWKVGSAWLIHQAMDGLKGKGTGGCGVHGLGHGTPQSTPSGWCASRISEAFVEDKGQVENEREGARTWRFVCDLLKLVFEMPSVCPGSSVTGRTDEVSGKGPRRIKIVWASGGKPSAVKGSSGLFSFGWLEPCTEEQCSHKGRPQGLPGGPGAQAGMVLGWPQSHCLGSDPQTPHQVTRLPNPLGRLTHHHLFRVPTGYLHHPEGRVHLHLGAGHELDDR